MFFFRVHENMSSVSMWPLFENFLETNFLNVFKIFGLEKIIIVEFSERYEFCPSKAYDVYEGEFKQLEEPIYIMDRGNVLESSKKSIFAIAHKFTGFSLEYFFYNFKRSQR